MKYKIFENKVKTFSWLVALALLVAGIILANKFNDPFWVSRTGCLMTCLAVLISYHFFNYDAKADLEHATWPAKASIKRLIEDVGLKKMLTEEKHIKQLEFLFGNISEMEEIVKKQEKAKKSIQIDLLVLSPLTWGFGDLIYTYFAPGV